MAPTEAGRVYRWCVALNDIDDMKRAEEALRESAQSSRSIVDGIPGFVATLSPNGAVEAVNRQILEHTGHPLEELMHWGSNGIVHPADMPHVAEIFVASTADRVQLQQVILNLLLNASDAMSTIRDRQRLTVIRTAPDGHGVRVSVQDAGVGFASEDAERLFEACYSTKTSGMGIGLSVSRSIIERHRGRLWASSMMALVQRSRSRSPPANDEIGRRAVRGAQASYYVVPARYFYSGWFTLSVSGLRHD